MGPESPAPLIFIPGAFGSSLRDQRSGRELWPASDLALLFGRYDNLELTIDPGSLEPVSGPVVAERVFEDGLGQDFYGQVLRTLETAGGYRLRRPGEPVDHKQRSYYTYLYDWRLDNAAAAIGLADLITRIRADYGDPELKVDILAHSNGGLLARYFARFGRASLTDSGPLMAIDPGADAIRQLIMVGTPNLGTLQPVLSHLRGEEIGLSRIRPEVMATCPGATQLLPHPAIPWLVDLRGRVVQRDVYSIDTWREFGWSIFDTGAARRIVAQHGGGKPGRLYLELLERYFARQLVRGRRFTEALSAPVEHAQVNICTFGGDCAPTLARLVLEQADGRMRARERPADIAAPLPGVDYSSIMFEPGDLVVTRDSLEGRFPPTTTQQRETGLANDHVVFLCEEHRRLTGNPTFQDNLLHRLLRHPVS